MDPDDRPPPPVDLQMASTVTLLEAARAGNAAAREGLFARYVQPLARWASRRLPPGHRSVADTRDLVQDVLLGALRRLDTFDCRGEGALLAYLRRAVINRVRDLARVEQRRPPQDVLASDIVGSEASPLDLAIGSQAIARYEAALARLRPSEQQAIIARFEFGNAYAQIAEATGSPSPDAARVMVRRAVLRLAREMAALARERPAGREAGSE